MPDTEGFDSFGVHFSVKNQFSKENQMEIQIFDAGDIAKKRLFDYLDEKIGEEDDQVRWEFYSFLLEKAKGHKLDFSGYSSLAQQQDKAEALAVCRKRNTEYKEGEFRLPERRKSRHL